MSHRTVSRRAVARGATWSVPVIATAAAAPAYAQSTTACTPAACLSGPTPAPASVDLNNTSFIVSGTPGELGNGWTIATTGTFDGSSGTTGFKPDGFTFDANQSQSSCSSYHSTGQVSLTGPVIVGQGDPSLSNGTTDGVSIIVAKTICLQAGKVYTFSTPWINYRINKVTAYMDMYVVPGADATGGTSLGRVTALRDQQENQSGTLTTTFSPATTQQHTVYYKFTFGPFDTRCLPESNPCRYQANDIAINAPSVTCA